MRLLSLAVVLLTLGLVACGGNTTQDAEAAERQAPQADSRLVVLNPTLTETLFALGVGDQVVATDVSSTHPAQAAQLPKVGYHRMLEAEKILAHQPDRVLATNETGPQEVLDQLKASGLALSVFELPVTLAQAPAFYRALGDSLDQGQAADSLAQALEQTLAQLQANPLPQAPRVLALYDRGGADKLFLIGTGTPSAVLIEGAGGQLAVDAGGHKEVSKEVVLASQADWLVLPQATLEALNGPEGLKTHPTLGTLPAVQSGQVVALPGPVFFGLGAHTATTLRTLRNHFGGQAAATAQGSTKTTPAKPA